MAMIFVLFMDTSAVSMLRMLNTLAKTRFFSIEAGTLNTPMYVLWEMVVDCVETAAIQDVDSLLRLP